MISSPKKWVTKPCSHSSSPGAAHFLATSSKYSRRSMGIGPSVQSSVCLHSTMESPVSWLRTAIYPSRHMIIAGPMSLEKLQIQRTSSSVSVSSVLPKQKTWCEGFQNLTATHKRWQLTSTPAAFKSLGGMPHKLSFSRSSATSLPIQPRRTPEQCVGVTKVGKPILLARREEIGALERRTGAKSPSTCNQSCTSVQIMYRHTIQGCQRSRCTYQS